ncbi:MAG: phosphatase PAP2 family protein [Burkholderiales bacterium]|nr:phosphatase PAP2 family protein [Burkholderiales bacterium]
MGGVVRGLQHWLSDLAGRAGAVVGAGFLLALAYAWLGRWTARHEAALKDRWRRLREQPLWRALERRLEPQIAWLHARLSPTSYLGLRLSLGVAVIVGTAWLFCGVAGDVVDRDPLTRVDAVLAQWLQDHAVAPLTALALAVSHAHDAAPVILATALLCTFLAWRRQYAWMLITMLTVPGGMLLNWGLKLAFQRPRPTVSAYAQALQSYSFPSGHTVAATLFYGLLAVYLVSVARTWTRRVTVVWLALACIVVVAFSRVYLGVHYLSDVLAAMAVGAFWLALCTTAVHTLATAREARNGTAGTAEAMPTLNQQEGHIPR